MHNDYVSGGLELARTTGAAYVVPAGSGVEFEHVSAGDGEVLTTGAMRLRVLHTPGHTHHHVSYTLQSGDGEVEVVFTGGSMLFGATGRTDLVGPDSTIKLTHAQYHSVRRLAAELPAAAKVMPTHGFGSFCSATPTSGNSSTVGAQCSVNPALTLANRTTSTPCSPDWTSFPPTTRGWVRLTAAAQPRWTCRPRNRSSPPNCGPASRQGSGWSTCASGTAFAAGHLAGSFGLELSTNFVTYLGWLYREGTPITLIGETPEQIADARRELVRIGVDELAGAATGDIAVLADGQPLRSYPVTDFAGLIAARAQRPVHVIDARRNEERARGHVAGSQHIPLHELAERREEVPRGEVWLYCGSGYRASIAASILDRPGRHLVLINDSYDAAILAGLQDQRPAPAAATAPTPAT